MGEDRPRARLGRGRGIRAQRVALTGDVHGESGSGTGRQLGLRVKAAEGVKLLVAAGRQGGESSGRAVAAWEF